MADVLSKGGLFSCRAAVGKTSSSLFSSAPSSPAVESMRCFSSGYFHGGMVVLLGEDRGKNPTRGSLRSVPVQMSLCVGKAMKWWEKGLQPNMKEIHSAQDLVHSLSSAGDKLAVVDFFSPGCGGCRALHPKICQFAEMNPDVQFLQVNYEEHKSMCYTLNVHVLPFFRFYRGPQGRLCSFSCTNATIKKFKDALAKHNTGSCSQGPARGLEESELMALSANKDLCFTYATRAEPVATTLELTGTVTHVPKTTPFSPSPKVPQEFEDKSVVKAGR